MEKDCRVFSWGVGGGFRGRCQEGDMVKRGLRGTWEKEQPKGTLLNDASEGKWLM